MSELNLIPYEVKNKKNSDLKNRQYVSALVIILVLLFAGIIYPKTHLYLLENQNRDLKLEVENGKKVLEENIKGKAEIASYNSYVEISEMLTKDRVIASAKIQGLEKHTPADVVLKGLKYGKGIINITGTTKNFNSISEFGANLQMSKEYKESGISNITFDNIEYTFTINITEVGGEQVEKAK